MTQLHFHMTHLLFTHHCSSRSILSIIADKTLSLFQIPLPIAPLCVIVLSLFVFQTHVLCHFAFLAQLHHSDVIFVIIIINGG